jgi:O-antigen ligase
VPQILNHYSYAIAGALALIAVGWWAVGRRSIRALAVLLAAAFVIVGVDLVFRPGEPSFATVADFDRAIAAGRPALVEFYSNY